MPTLGEFITRAQAYGYTKHVIRIRELRARIIYLRRGTGALVRLVDLPPIRETTDSPEQRSRACASAARSPKRTLACSRGPR